MKNVLTIVLALSLGAPLFAAGILFDHTKNETAGQADWVIDNNEPTPSPAQSGITGTTSQNYWTGGISAWGVGLVKLGHTVTTLAATDSITYGRAGNPRDLSLFKVFVVCEPQNLFSAREKKAIFDFVRAGGGLFMVGDHDGSDRDNDGFDSPRVWDSLGIKDSFGLYFDTSATTALSNFSESSRSFNPAAGDSIISGPLGHADTLAFHNGSAITLFTAKNPTAVSHFWRASNSAASMCASARFGQGKVMGIGDSSPADDSTGQSGNTLYNGWGEGEDSIVFLNATAWLAASGPAGIDWDGNGMGSVSRATGAGPRQATAAPNPSRGQVVITYQLPHEANVAIELYAIDGRRVAVFAPGRQAAGTRSFRLPEELSTGTYLYQVRGGGFRATGRLTIFR